MNQVSAVLPICLKPTGVGRFLKFIVIGDIALDSFKSLEPNSG